MTKQSMLYDAFISYSHKGDGKIAPLLQHSLKHLAKPWYRLRSLNVFMDETDLSASSDLTGAIRKALSSSRYFIYMASPESAASEWVGKEIDAWRERDLPENILIAVTAGEIEWDSGRQSFKWENSNAIHPNLKGMFSGEPLWVDLRWVRSDHNLSPRDPRFRHAIAMLASSISGKTLDELIGEDVRQHRRTKRMIGTVIGVLTFLLAFSILISIIATKANRSLQSKIDMIESVFPFFNIPVTETSQDFKETGMEEDGEKSFFRRLWSSIRTNFTMPVEMETWVKWGPDRLVVADDCHDYYKKGVDLDLDCPKIRTDFDQDGLRTDIPGLNAMARTLVRSLNNGRFLQMLSRNSENDSIDRFSEVDEGTVSEVGEETVGEIMNFAMILLPDRLLKQVDMRIRGDQSRKFDPSTHHYLNIWRYPLQSAREESELILMALMDTGYIGSGVSTELILGFLRIGERYELIMAMDWEAAGRIAIYDAGRGNMPQIFTIGMAQAGIPEQSRYMACYNFDRTKFYYEPYLSGSVTSYDSHADQKVPKQLEPMKRIDRGVDSYK